MISVAYREIVTKAVIGKGKKKYSNDYQIIVEENPSTVLGCWIINHNFVAKEVNDKIIIDGSFDVNVWYSYDNDTKTKVINNKINYTEEEKMIVKDSNIVNKDIIVRSLKQPTCVSAKEEGNIINLVIEKELGIEIIGDTKVRISSLEEDDDTWENLDVGETEENIEKIDTEYIKDTNKIK